jgi:hypothetical protein
MRKPSPKVVASWNKLNRLIVSERQVAAVGQLKKDPAILTALERLLEDETAGDPCSVLKWKHKSLRRLSAALAPSHHASPPTVRRLLAKQDYSCKANRKQLAISSPYRDEQFGYIQAQKRSKFGLESMISMTKQHEMG